MGKINSRAKGAAGEREFCKELTLFLGDALVEPLKRNLEQTRNGGHDILGLEGFALEIKRYKRIKDGDIKKFWDQACEQATRIGATPTLAFREDMQSWRIRIPIGVLDKSYDTWHLDYTVEVGLEAFAAIIREQHSATLLLDGEIPK